MKRKGIKTTKTYKKDKEGNNYTVYGVEIKLTNGNWVPVYDSDRKDPLEFSTLKEAEDELLDILDKINENKFQNKIVRK